MATSDMFPIAQIAGALVSPQDRIVNAGWPDHARARRRPTRLAVISISNASKAIAHGVSDGTGAAASGGTMGGSPVVPLWTWTFCCDWAVPAPKLNPPEDGADTVAWLSTETIESGMTAW